MEDYLWPEHWELYEELYLEMNDPELLKEICVH